MRIPSGKTDQLIFFVALDSTDRVTRKTGLSAFTVYRSRNGGTATVYTTPTVTELSSANMPGVYALTVDEDTTIASTSDSEEYCVHITCATMAPVSRTFELYRRDITSGNTLVVDAAGLADANMVKMGPTGTGTAQTARDIGTSVLISAGTGTGQLDVTTGVVKANLAQILDTALTETAGQIAAAFKKFFNIAAPAATMDHGVLVDTVTTYTGNTPQTGDAYARLGAPAGASVSADVAAVKVDTAAIKVQTDKVTFTVTNQVDVNVLDWKSATAPAMTGDAYARIGAAGAGLTSLGDARIAHLDADVSSRSTYAGADTSGTTTLLGRVTATRAGYLDNLSGGAVATYDQVGHIAVTGAALNLSAASRTITTGSETGTIANATAVDVVYHQLTDAGGTLDMYYQFDVGSDGTPVGVTMTGHLTSVVGNLIVEAYNWGASTWDQVGTIAAKVDTADLIDTFDLLTTHVGSGGNVGLVRVRFYGTGLTTLNLYVDQIFLSYARAAPTVAQIADEVWEEAIADHSGTAGSVAATLAAAGSLGDPWATALPGAYSSGQAGKIVGTYLDAAVSAAALQTTLVDVQGDVDGIETTVASIHTQTTEIGVAGAGLTALGDVRIAHLDTDVSSRLPTSGYTAPLGAAGTRTAVGLASANLDTQIATLATSSALATVNTTVNGINTKTTNLPSDPASASTIATEFSTLTTHGDSAWSTATGFATSASLSTTDGKVDGIKSVTDSLVMTAGKLWVLDETGNPLPHTSDISTIEADIAALPTASNNAAAVLAATYEGSETIQSHFRLARAALYGKANGLGGTTANFRDAADTKNRITATVDADGNRAAVTTDAT